MINALIWPIWLFWAINKTKLIQMFEVFKLIPVVHLVWLTKVSTVLLINTATEFIHLFIIFPKHSHFCSRYTKVIYSFPLSNCAVLLQSRGFFFLVCLFTLIFNVMLGHKTTPPDCSLSRCSYYCKGPIRIASFPTECHAGFICNQV